MRKADFYIIGIVLLVALIGFVVFYIERGSAEYVYAEIYVFGELTHRVMLDSGQDDILIDTANVGWNLIRTTRNGVYVVEASCRNQNCVLSGKHYRPGQIIACLPDRVVVRLVGLESGGVDAIAY
jgi:hypothetical protein